jgi:elongation factor G
MSIDVSSTRTFALIGHGGDGKTTLADSIAMAGGVTNRLGSVESGTSFMNFLPEEKARRITISTSICSFDADGLHYTMLDTPGDANFAGELMAALHAVDHAVLVISASDGIKVGTQKAYRLARERNLSVTAIANKMDHEAADYGAVAEALEKDLGARVVKLHLPIGTGTGFVGYVDLISQRAFTFSDDSGKASPGDIPADLADACAEARMAMIEAVAEGDDAILEKYLEEGELSEDEILATLRTGVREGTLMPLLATAGGSNIGGAAVLSVASRFFPDPSAGPARTARRDEEELRCSAEADGPFRAIVWKSVADRYAGVLSILRVVSGTLSPDLNVVNARTGTKERLSKILALQAESTSDVKEVGPGGIAALPKLRDTHTGDTLCDDRKPVTLERVEPPRGVISFAVEASNKGDEDKVFECLNRLLEEDASLHLGRDERTHEFLLTGLGQLHIEVTLEKLKRLFGVDVTLKPPKVPYLETIVGRAEFVEGKLKKQSGGRGQFGVCYLNVMPGARGTGVEFVDKIVGGAIPRGFIPAVEKGVREACSRGVLAGFPLTDIVVECVDGKHHNVDSSEQAFKTAGSLGIKAAVAKAKATLLEPVMEVEIAVSDESVGDIMGDLNSRRGKVAGVDARGSTQVIRAHVPMSEMLSYASDLTSMTGGTGSFVMELSSYEEVPAQIREKLVAEAKQPEEE